MSTRQLILEDCQAVADLETQLFDGRYDAAGFRALLGKPAFYGAVLPAPDMPTTIHAYCLALLHLCRQILLPLAQKKPSRAADLDRSFYSI